MDVLIVAAEIAPYARRAGAAEAVASLAKSLRQLGHEVTVAAPRSPGFEAAGLLLARRLTPLEIPGLGELAVCDGQLSSGVRLTLIDAPAGTELGEAATARSLGWLGIAAAALAAQRAEQGKAFDAVHAHDFAAALAVVRLRTSEEPRPVGVLTVHDASEAGEVDAATAAMLGVEPGGSLLALGVRDADVVTLVSEAEARELLQGSRFGAVGLAAVERENAPVVIESGLDASVYNPATDSGLPTRYDAEQPANKGRCKTKLIQELELELDPSRPLVVVLCDAELAKLLATAAKRLAPLDATWVVAGEAALPSAFAHGKRVDRLDGAAERRALAAADFVLLPRRRWAGVGLEAAAQRYGALPIVGAPSDAPATGVVDCDAELASGSGFVFEEGDAASLVAAVQRAVAAYGAAGFGALLRRVMRLDHGWDRPARRYAQLYRGASRG